MDFDCPLQGSETASMYGQNLNGIGHADGDQIAVTDFRIDHVELNVEQAQEEREEGDKWNLEGLHPSDCDDNGETYAEFEVEGQKLAFGSHDSDDDKIRDNSSGLHMGTTESRTPNSNEEAGLSVSEPQWLQKDEALAVWVKWRGQWQAGIRCARADWPLPTLRAKPTHDRKKYIVIFFPRTRNFSWADVLFVRPIGDYPQPIAYKTHKVGMKMVKDLTLARRFIMQKISVNMLSVLDQLHSEALIEAARNVTAWKELAMEASRCQAYSDLGKILFKLQNMILPSCISSQWSEHSLTAWVERCQNANSAESIELLKEELVDSIIWDEVHSRSHVTPQHELSSEWKSWKQEVMKWFSMSNFSSSGGDPEEAYNDNSLSAETQMNRKRPKLEIRRADVHASQVVQGSNPNAAVEINAAFFNGDGVDHTLASEVSKDMLSVKKSGSTDSPMCVSDGWGMIVAGTGNFDFNQIKDVEFTPENRAVTRKPTSGTTKNRQCIAYIESKGRKCVRWANEGDVYCCVHLNSRYYSGSSSKPPEVVTVPGDFPMCSGTTVLGTKCKHRSLPGSSFCKKHRPREDREMTSGSLVNNLKRRHEYTDVRLDTTSCKEIVFDGQVGTPLEAEPITIVGREAANGSYTVDMPDQIQGESNSAVCIGLWSQNGCEPCRNVPKWHSLYCEKHVPSWLKRARNGRSRIISKEVFVQLSRNCDSREQKLNFHRACELFYRLFKSIQSFRNPVPKEVQFQWALSEASKDSKVGESLLKLVTSEKGRLEKLWGFNINNVQSSYSLEEPVTIPLSNDGDNQSIIKCKLCSVNFSDDQKLGSHWMEHHKKEAQWLFRGYVCAICLESFTNRKVLESHVQDRHRVDFVEQCMLLQCISCSSHFGNFEQLWSHVLLVHSADLKFSHASEGSNVPMMVDSMQNFDPMKSALVEHVNSEGNSTVRRFICRFCGLRFDLLPDLGRHHQAAHMGSVPMGGPRLPKRGLRLYAQKLKSGRLTRPGFKKVFGSAAYRIRNRNAHSIKKHIQSTDFANTAKIKIQPDVLDTTSHLGRLVDSQCSAVAKVLFSEVKRTKPRPSNLEILSIASSTCCKVSLLASLEAKYSILPQRIYLKAAKLCSEHNIVVNWHQEDFVCPRGCQQIVSSGQLSLLSSLSVNSIAPRCSVPSSTPATSEWEMDESHYVIDSRHFNQDAAERIILCDDITFGKESIPIACVVDETLLGSLHILADGPDGPDGLNDQIMTDSLPWEGFTYITKLLLGQSLDLEVESSQLGCSCAYSICSPATCDHVYLFDNDYEDAKDIYGKSIHGRFPYDERGRIILEEGYLVYECNQMCRCSKACQNRVLQNGVRVKLEIFKTDKKGWAVRSRQTILRGTFVCEYIGEVIDETEASERRNRYGNEGCKYIYEIDAQLNDISRLIEGKVSFVIDATNHGNVSRYINHSCSPNLVNHQVVVERMDCQLAHIGLFASRDIAMGEELTYDYQYKPLSGEGIPCLCGASNCRGRLY